MIRKYTKRHIKDFALQILCLTSVLFVLILLSILLFSIAHRGMSVFKQAEIEFTVTNTLLSSKNYEKLNQELRTQLVSFFKNSNLPINRNQLYKLLSDDAPYVAKQIMHDYKIGDKFWLPTSSVVSSYLKQKKHTDTSALIKMLDYLKEHDLIRLDYNFSILTHTDSRFAESAGILGGMIGTFYTIFICIMCSIPLGVFAATYLQEYAPKNWLRDLLEININNLAAVPSIVYGLIGLSILIGKLNLPRSSSLVAGITLALLTLPAIIITTRESIKSVPNTIKQGALALGASKLQTIFHHILPLATPGILTGSILCISRAIGETAPLILLGMVAFISDIPTSIEEPTTTMSVLIYNWSDSPEYGFVERASAAIFILMMIILSLNYIAIAIRKGYKNRW